MKRRRFLVLAAGAASIAAPAHAQPAGGAAAAAQDLPPEKASVDTLGRALRDGRVSASYRAAGASRTQRLRLRYT